MLIKRRFVCALPLITAVMLSACGFHLRGSGAQANLPFKTIYVAFPESSPLGTELKRNITATGVAIAAEPKSAEAILEALSEAREKTTLSLNSQGRVREYGLSYRLAFQVKDNAGNELLPPTEITLRRTLSFNESQVLAKESEEAMLYRDMQNDMVQQVLRRVAAIKPNEVKPDQIKPDEGKPAQ